MSRMVRENDISGLRERLFFARDLLKTLRAEAGSPMGHRLALRGAVVFHLYSVLVGMARQSAKSYQVAGYDDLISLAGLERAFAEAGIRAPEMQLLIRARQDRSDLVCWLDLELHATVGAAGLARRATPPGETNALAMRAEDPYAPLADGDLERLQKAADRVEMLIGEFIGYQDEW